MKQATSSNRASAADKLVLAVLAAVVVITAALPAMAQGRRGPIVVLGLRAPNGDDEAATNATGALRRAARSAGFDVPNESPALEQSMAAFGCDESLPPECLSQITADLHAPRVIYGAVRRRGRGRDAQLSIEVSLFETATHTTTRHDQAEVARALAQDADALNAPARRLIDSLLPPPAEVTAPPPPEQRAAPTDTAPLPIRRYAGYAAAVLGVGGIIVGAIGGIQSISLSNTLNTPGNPDATAWMAYRPDDNSGTSVCMAASMDTSAAGMTIDGICGRNDGYTTMQIAGYAVGGVLLIAGVVLILTDSTPASSAAPTNAQRRLRNDRLRFSAAPVMSPSYQGASLQVQF